MCPTSISFDGATDFKISGGNFGEVEGNMTVITSNDPEVLLSLQPLINNAQNPRKVGNRGRVPSPRLSTQSSNHERRSRSSSVSSFDSPTTEDGGAESGYSTPPSSTDGHQSDSFVSSVPPHTQLPSLPMPPPRPQTFHPSLSLLPDGAAQEPRDQHSYTRSPRRGFSAENQTQTNTPSDTPTMPTRPNVTMELLSTPGSGRSSIRTQTVRTSSRPVPRPSNPEPFQLPSQSTPSPQTGTTCSGYSRAADTRTDVTSSINRVPHHRGSHTSQPIQPQLPQLYVTENTSLIRNRYIHSRRLPEPPNPHSTPYTPSYSSNPPRRLANLDPRVLTSPTSSPHIYSHPSVIPTGPNDSDSMASIDRVGLQSGDRQYSVTSVPAFPPTKRL
ncbi:hypothetical protein AN958_04014 [Leucoagaricus sp. SymC.cos]|nr:hypothetical protein AN958_04014 [Leucoagaricus sp. SymC.cos]